MSAFLALPARAGGGMTVGVVLVVVLTWHDLRCRQIAAQAAGRPEADASTGIRQRQEG